MIARNKKIALACGCALPMLFGFTGGAIAQTQAPSDQAPSNEESAEAQTTDETGGAEDQAAASDGGDIIVTGSRLPSGFRAPTPVLVSTSEELRAAAPASLADGLNTLPAFAGSLKTATPSTTNSRGGNSGQNLLNLRALGLSRTLLLFDGKRMPATSGGGGTDVNILPQGLVSRVDVVTGGASAAYGSDAVAGVVNFILDSRFDGFKAEIINGISTHGDLPSTGGSLAFGKSLMNDRLHFVAGFDAFYQKGLRADQTTGRKWFDENYGQLANPVAGATPKIFVIPDIRSSIGTYGGLITSTALAGTQFLAGGVTAPFNRGTISNTSFQSGGDGARTNIGLMPTQKRYNGFVRTEFEASPAATLFIEGLYAKSHTTQGAFVSPNTGSTAAYTIFRDNAYLPANIRAQMVALNIQSFRLGRYEKELPLGENESILDVYHASGGVRGDLGKSWKYDLSYSFGQTSQELRSNYLTINRNLYAAADAVVDPATGRIVCRSTLSGYDPGCTPRNLFGPQQSNQAISDYVTGDSVIFLRQRQQVIAANIRGDLGDNFQLAGPISVALGIEYRRESARQRTDALSPTVNDFTGVRGVPSSLVGRQGPFRFFNPLPFDGRYNIKEGYLEVAVPILKDSPLGRSLDLNGAIRHADYSTSGGVTTWKIGGSWEPFDDLRLRGTYSQDIRAPNLLELYNPGTQLSGNVIYNGVTTPQTNYATGNPDLKPERARTLTFGAVYQPGWASGLQASVDYYQIKLQDAISTLAEQRVVDECAAGNTAQCANITVLPGSLVLRRPNLNLAQFVVAGIDFEVRYKTSFAGGDLGLRVVGNHSTKNSSTTPGSAPRDVLGETTTPKWSGALLVNWDSGPFSLFVQERFIGASKIDATKVVGIDIDRNHVPAVFYTNLTATYKLAGMGGKQELFLTVANLFNREPPISPPAVSTFTTAASPAYDPIGRYFTVGFRAAF